jgi:hypothetical protein
MRLLTVLKSPSVTGSGQPVQPIGENDILTADGSKPPFHPVIDVAEVELDSVNRLVGRSVPILISYAQTYVNNEFGPENKGCVFAQVADATLCSQPGIDFKGLGNKSFGLVTPDMNLIGLSALTGPISGQLKQAGDSVAEAAKALENYAKSRIDLRSLFGEAKLFGEIKLSEILGALEIDIPKPDIINAPSKVPSLVTRLEDGGKTIVTEYSWETTNLTSNGLFQPDTGHRLRIKVQSRVPIAGGKPDLFVECELSNFSLNLIPGFKMVTLSFESILFTSRSGESPKISPKLKGVSFGENLDFVKKIAEHANPGSKLIPKLEIGPKQISAKFMFPIPNLTMGAVTITNLRFGVGFHVPLDDGRISVSLQLADRMDPFSVAVSIFGGGGYFKLTASGAGLDDLQMALEFGAIAALDFGGLASGKIEIKGGIFYERDSVNKRSVLAAYLRAAGSLNVLGLITVSVVFYLELSYESESNSLYGTASVTVEIDLLFFSKSVTLTVERRLAGSERSSSNLPPSGLLSSLTPVLDGESSEDKFDFEAFVPQEAWTEYLEAFDFA